MTWSNRRHLCIGAMRRLRIRCNSTYSCAFVCTHDRGFLFFRVHEFSGLDGAFASRNSAFRFSAMPQNSLNSFIVSECSATCERWSGTA